MILIPFTILFASIVYVRIHALITCIVYDFDALIRSNIKDPSYEFLMR